MAKLNSNAKWVERFYDSSRSIQRAYNFTVLFPVNYNDGPDLKGRLSVISDSAGFPDFNPGDYLNEFHVKKVNLSQFKFKREMQSLGIFQKTYPVLDHKGLELEIEFEEDALGTVGFFIQWLQARIIDEQGVYTSLSEIYIDPITVNITDERSDLVATYSFRNCYFLDASKGEYDYRNNKTVTYSIIFGTDFYDIEYSNGSVPSVLTNQNPNNSSNTLVSDSSNRLP